MANVFDQKPAAAKIHKKEQAEEAAPPVNLRIEEGRGAILTLDGGGHRDPYEIPLPPPKVKRRAKTLYLDADVLLALEQMAKRRGIGQSALVNAIFRGYFGL